MIRGQVKRALDGERRKLLKRGWRLITRYDFDVRGWLLIVRMPIALGLATDLDIARITFGPRGAVHVSGPIAVHKTTPAELAKWMGSR